MAAGALGNDPSVRPSLAENSAFLCYYYNRTLIGNRMLKVERTGQCGPIQPPEMAETGGTYRFVVIGRYPVVAQQNGQSDYRHRSGQKS